MKQRVLGVVAVSVLLTACGGGDGDGDGDSGETLDDGTTLESSVEGIFANNGLVDVEITDEEIRIELDQGSATDTVGGCTSASGINDELVDGRSIVIVYPDGDVTCDN